MWKIKSDKAEKQKESNTGSEKDNKARNKKKTNEELKVKDKTVTNK